MHHSTSSRALRRARIVAASLAAGGLSACTPQAPPAAQPPRAAAEAAPELLTGLGDHSLPITTSSPLAQRYFDQGLTLTYGFNHEAAVRSFEEAARLDPRCGACFWGIALALGPNINAPMGPEAGRKAYAAAQEALARADGMAPLEQDLIRAVAVRYAAEPPEDRAALDLAYANAMREVHARHPEDTDVATLTAEALMDLTPWNYWTDDGKPREHTAELVALLEWVIEREPSHLGANHYYIHAIEKFEPEKGIPSADRLAGLSLGAGHLVHMPSHIYWRVGRYADALSINQRASAADESFFATCRAGAFYRAAYYPHNLHFLWAAASAEGQSELALQAARKLEAETRGKVGEFDFLEEFLSIPTLTLVRFGRFDAVLGEPRPAPERPYLIGIWHYARGVARARTGDLAAARAELDALRAAQADPRAEALVLGGGAASAAKLLSIGVAHLEGEIEAAAGHTDAGIAALERAVGLQDGLTYTEPPPWYFPTRQALGARLLDAGRARQAEAVYRRDLEQYPKNGWSLFGLAQSLEAEGRAAEAAWAQRGFRTAFARADVTLERSVF
jgi:tetratricopeptide (TPR) repeat protein